jgi:hypothetical protein
MKSGEGEEVMAMRERERGSSSVGLRFGFRASMAFQKVDEKVSLHGDIGGHFRGGICAVPSTNEGAGRRRGCGGAAQAMAEDDSGHTTSLAYSLPLLVAQRLCNLSSR